MKEIFRFLEHAQFENPSLIVGWEDDAGRLGPRVIAYLNKAMNGRSFCELDPVRFFSLAGVVIENDVARFPEGKFYHYGRRRDLLVLESSEPVSERHEFLNAVTDLAQNCFKIKDLHTIGGTVCPIAHNSPRRILAVFNQPAVQEKLRGCGLQDMNWKGPPATSSYLLWVAKNKGIPGMSLWPQVPFYLAPGNDFQAIRQTLSFLDERFSLSLDFRELDDLIKQQDKKISQLRQEDSDVDKYIAMLESELSLASEEQTELTEKVAKALERRN